MALMTNKISKLTPYFSLIMLILAVLSFYLNNFKETQTDEFSLMIRGDIYSTSKEDIKDIRIVEFSGNIVDVSSGFPIIVNSNPDPLKNFELTILYNFDNNISFHLINEEDTIVSNTHKEIIKENVIKPYGVIKSPFLAVKDIMKDTLYEVHCYYQMTYDGLKKPIYFYYDLFIDPLLGPDPINYKHNQHKLLFKKEFLRIIKEHYPDHKLILTINDTTVLSTTDMLKDHIIENFHSISQLEKDWNNRRVYLYIFIVCISLLVYLSLNNINFKSFTVYEGYKLFLCIIILLLYLSFVFDL